MSGTINHRSKDFEFLSDKCFLTDDSIMTFAVGKAILEADGDIEALGRLAVHYMQKLGRLYPDYGYGLGSACWLQSADPQPYNSFGNGAAMRVSAA